MSATITVHLSDAAQRAALLAGQPAQREQAYEVPAELLPRLLALPWSSVAADGTANCTVPNYWRPAGAHGEGLAGLADYRPCDADDAIAHGETLVAAGAALAEQEKRTAEERQAQRDAEQAERVAADRRLAAEWASRPLADRASAAGICNCIPGEAPSDQTYSGPLAVSGRCRYDRRVLAEYEPAAYAEASHEAVRLSTVEEEARRESAAARLRRLAALASEHGDETVRARIAAGPAPLGLLPEAEAWNIVQAGRLPVAGDLAEYRKLSLADVRESCTCRSEYADEHGGSVSFRALPPEHAESGGVTAVEWHRIAEARAALAAVKLPEGKIRVHLGQCDSEDCPDWPARRIGLLVEIDLGEGLVVRREYAAGK